MKRRFLAWALSFDPALRGRLGPWVGAALCHLVLVLAACLPPGAPAFFQLDLSSALVVWAVAFGPGFLLWWLDRRLGLTAGVAGAAMMLQGTLSQFAPAGFVSLSQPPGSMLFGAVFLFVAGLLGHMFRSSLHYPFGLVMTLAAIAAALWLDPGADNLTRFSVLGPAALSANWMMGTFAYRAQRERQRVDELKAAVHAQMLDDASRDVSRLQEAMLRVLQANHDASSALSTALIQAELLRKAGEARRRGEPVLLDERAATEDLSLQLGRIRRLVEEMRDIGQPGGGHACMPEAVLPLPVVRDVLRDAGLRCPGVHLCVTGSDTCSGVRVNGGVESLQRVLDNLVSNACQGDGRRHARRVEVNVQEEPGTGSVAIRVRDDGPGFTAQQLAQPITGFQSSKADGGGLGLYTVERLVRASGGSIRRANAPSGGAEVTVLLHAVA